MRRFGTMLAVGTVAFAMVAAPGAAAAQDSGRIDEKTGPVAFANVASMDVSGKNVTGGFVITETQRSPLGVGVSELAQSRSTLPASAKEKKSVGEHYLVEFGPFEMGRSSYPAAVRSKEHEVAAALREGGTPDAIAEANYALRDLRLEGTTGPDNTVLAFQGVRNKADCASVDKVTAETAAEKLWVLDENKQLVEKALPEGEQKLELTGLPFSGPRDPTNDKTPIAYEPELTTSDIAISRVTAFDKLLRQDEWRGGDVQAVAGWHVEVTTHYRKRAEQPDDGETTAPEGDPGTTTPGDTEDQGTGTPQGEAGAGESDRQGEPRPVEVGTAKTKLVLGGVSCALPKGFVGGGNQPAVPVKIPAGRPAEGADKAAGLLLGSGAVLGSAALLLLLRRRRLATVRPGERDEG